MKFTKNKYLQLFNFQVNLSSLAIPKVHITKRGGKKEEKKKTSSFKGKKIHSAMNISLQKENAYFRTKLHK